MSNRTIAITVTYNRSETLSKTIECLVNQSGKNLERILIVDNKSSDTHKERIHYISKLYADKIELIELEENLGGAGGFYEGLKYAYEKYDMDWFWIMDDDAYPAINCLESLLENTHLENIGSLLPLIYGIDKNEYQFYHYKDVSKDFLRDKHYFVTLNDVKNVNVIKTGAFVGPLISKEAVKNNGLPDPGLFIYGDDFEYLYRISENQNNYLIKNAIINHNDIPMDKNGVMPIFWWKQYYKYRNRFLFITKYCDSKYSGIWYKMKLSVLIVLRLTKQILANSNLKGNRFLITKTILSSIIDGVRGKNGKNIDPRKYISEIK